MCKKLILSVHVTADGFMAGPDGELDWQFDYWNNELAEYTWHQLNSVGTLLLGRVAYEAMADHWPNYTSISTREMAFAQRMNELPKVVFSKSLKQPHWNNTHVVAQLLREEVQRLKLLPGKDLLLLGGVRIVSAFIRLGLIDEYRIFVTPVVLGKGQALYTATQPPVALNLLGTQTFSNGVVLINYQPSNEASTPVYDTIPGSNRNI